MTPKVSVLLPVYQTETYISEAIESVIGQTFSDWELVVSDNRSTDRTLDIVRSFGDKRIRLFCQPENIGSGPNWTFCARQAIGEYACVLGADDAFLPDHLDRKLKMIESNPSSSFVHGPAYIVGVGGENLRTFVPEFAACVSSKEFLERNLSGNLVNAHTALYRLRNRSGGKDVFDSRYKILMDWQFWNLLALRSSAVLCDDIPTIRYRVHPLSTTNLKMASFEWSYESLLLRRDLFVEHADAWRQQGFDPEKEKKELLRGLWRFAFQRVRRGKFAEARMIHSLYAPELEFKDMWRELNPFSFSKNR